MSQVTVLPANEDTASLIDVHVDQLERDVIPFTNGSGSAIADSTFVIAGVKWCGVVQGGEVANGAVGSLNVEEGILIQADDLVSGEDTFDTVGAAVYFDSSAGEFSDTWTAGYYLVGYLVTAKDSAGVIEFEKLRLAELQIEAGTFVAPGEIGWIEYEVSADATGGLTNDFGFNFVVLDAFVECRAASADGTITVGDSTPDSITSAMVCAVDTTIGRTTLIDDDYATISDGTLTFTANGAADRGVVRLLVKGV